jgi:hypothetical protein
MPNKTANLWLLLICIHLGFLAALFFLYTTDSQQKPKPPQTNEIRLESRVVTSPTA